MTESLLLEIGLEELPAQYVRSSANQLGDRVATYFKEANLGYASLEVFATPRRLAVRVNDLEDQQEDRIEVFKGPSVAIAQKDGEWTKAAQGFVRGKGLTVDDIYVEDGYIYVKQELKGQSARDVVKGLSVVITDMKFPVTMRWADHHFEYLRPIHWIVALYGSDVIEEVQVLDVKADRTSRGHRFLGHEVAIGRPEQYESLLKDQFVIVNQDERKEMVRSQMADLAAANNWVIPVDEDLLEEVSAILEYPTVFSGTFDEKYLIVPAPVLVTSMKEHQRYFVVYNQDDELLPYFVSARNGNAHAIDNVAKGNQKVLTARLEDALFFYKEDQKIPMTTFLKKLETLNFHAKIGSMTEKMDRVQLLVTRLAKELNLPSDVTMTAQRAAAIYKFDLVTNMVGEFPELQGIMGEIYAKEQGETPEVAQAIREHYMPINADGDLPQTQAGALLAVADKLDSFLSFMSVGLLPTGSNDPYALRRQVMGMVQILEDQNWQVEIEDFAKLLLGLNYNDLRLANIEEVEASVLAFIRDRVAQRLAGVTNRHDITQAVIHSRTTSIPEQLEAAKVLVDAVDDASFKATAEAFNRVINISLKGLTPAELEEAVTTPVDHNLLNSDSERTLVQAIATLREGFNEMTPEEQFEQLRALTPVITAFFEENMVMVDDEAVRNNRLTFLRQLAQLLLTFADFSDLLVK